MLNTTHLRLAFSSHIAGAAACSGFPVTNGQNVDGAGVVWCHVECLLSEITAGYTANFDTRHRVIGRSSTMALF
jgi:hypothetical protein